LNEYKTTHAREKFEYTPRSPHDRARASDLDLLIEFKGQKSLFDLVGLKLALEAKIHRKVAVVTYRALHPALREQILAEQIIVLPAQR
jgi:predicted nucleotidyltransferase